MLSSFVGLRRRDRDTTAKNGGRRGRANQGHSDRAEAKDSESRSKVSSTQDGVNSSSTTNFNSTSSSTSTRRVSQQQQAIPTEKSRIWRSAIDAKTGRTYYYDVLTRETQWRKPIELASEEERLAMERKEQKQKEFFAAMEDNILRNLANGSYTPVSTESIEGEERDGLGQLKAVECTLASGDTTKVTQKPSRAVRTISSMDQHVLAELTRVEKENLQMLSMPASSALKIQQFEVSPTSVIIMSNNSAFDFTDHTKIVRTLSDSVTVSSSDDEDEKERAIAEVERVANAMAQLDDLSPSTQGSKESRNESSSSSSAVSCNLAKPSLRKRNTCSTLYVGSTMSAPDKDATIKCICGVYRAHILQAVSGSSTNSKITSFEEYEIFRDVSHSGRSDPVPSIAIPSLEDIVTFFREVFVKSQMESDCIIMSLIYVERLIKETNGGVQPHPTNWHSVLFSCMILASKVWDDLSMWNSDFSHCTRDSGVRFSLQRINELERVILSCLQYNVKVLASEYAKYYFFLRSMLIRSGLGGKDLKSLAPLDIEGARQMQLKSASAERLRILAASNNQTPSASSLLEKPRNRRSKSLDNEVRVKANSPESALKCCNGEGYSPACVRAQLEQIVHM